MSVAPAPVEDSRSALMDEYRSLAQNIADQNERAERLQALADQARVQAEAQEGALRELAELLEIDPQMRLEALDARIRGQRLQEIAVQVLSEHRPEGGPIHYKEWYGLLREAGYSVGGKEPLATFLASIGRSPQVRSLGRRSGLYAIAGGKVPMPAAKRGDRQRSP